MEVRLFLLTANYSFFSAPICLPEKNEDFLGKFGWAAGWGALNPGSRLRPKTLQAVDVPVIENRICERWHRQNGINVVIYPRAPGSSQRPPPPPHFGRA